MVRILAAPELADARVEGWRRRVWRTYVTDVRSTANARAVVSWGTDHKMVSVFVVATVALTCNNLLSDGMHPQWLESLLRVVGLHGLAHRLGDAMLVSAHRDFNQLAFWAIVVIVSYLVPAALCIRFLFHERIGDYGLRIKGIGRHLRSYAVLYAIDGAFPH